MRTDSGCSSVWLECMTGGHEVAGSSPVTPIVVPFGTAYADKTVFSYTTRARSLACARRMTIPERGILQTAITTIFIADVRNKGASVKRVSLRRNDMAIFLISLRV